MSENGIPRHPISAMPWHSNERGILVVCDDGTIWRWTLSKGWWPEAAVLPDGEFDVQKQQEIP